MLQTPLGKIVITINGEEVNYVATEYKCNYYPVNGCYRISIPFNENDSIKCKINTSGNIKKFNDSGEDYICKIFEKNKIQVTIGTFEKINESNSNYTEDGLIFENLKLKETNNIIFGISWVVDLKEDDVRTWYASDPSLDNV